MTPSLLSPLPSCACYSWPFLLLSICTLWLDRNEDIPHIAFDTLHALAYLNLHDIVHRNLSPENMLLNPKVKLSQSANCDNKPLSRHNNNNYMWGIFGEIFPNYYQVNSLSRARGKKKKRLRCTCSVSQSFTCPTFNSTCPLGKLERAERESVLYCLCIGIMSFCTLGQENINPSCPTDKITCLLFHTLECSLWLDLCAGSCVVLNSAWTNKAWSLNTNANCLGKTCFSWDDCIFGWGKLCPAEVLFVYNFVYLTHFLNAVQKIISMCIHLYALSELVCNDRSLGMHFQIGYV